MTIRSLFPGPVMAALIAVCLCLAGPARADRDNPFVAAAFDREKIDAAIASQAGLDPAVGVTGIIVPHHLLAADLIARGFRAASAGSYDRIVMLAPDHFRAVRAGFATTRSDFDTIYGPVKSDAAAAARLAASSDLIEELDNLDHEHGVVALMPFLKHAFPDTPVVTLIAAISTTPRDWRAAADALAPLVTGRTLIVQSTDFSHYLPLSRAVLRDQESLALIAAGDPEMVDTLIQPDHLDTKAGLYINMRLQQAAFASHPVVVANRNSADYGGSPDNTTSYVTALYLREPEEGGAFAPDDQEIVYMGGDVLLGRYMTPVLVDAAARKAVVERLHAATHGMPLIVNLEGVILDEPVAGLWDDAHLMLRELAVPLLKDMGVVAASVANNHSRDLGMIGFDETLRILRDAGIAPVEHARVADAGPVRIVALNYIAGRDTAPALYRAPGESAAVCGMEAAPPLIAFMHWGEEYTQTAGAREDETARVLADCGVQVIAGAHSHQASPAVARVPGRAVNTVFSLGNLLFDQRGDRASTALMELRVFAAGTVFARLVPLPNLFEYGSAKVGAVPAN